MELFKSKRRLLLMGIDCLIFAAVYTLTVLIMAVIDTAMFNSVHPLGYLGNAAMIALCVFSARIVAGIYSNMWRYSDSHMFVMLSVADAVGGVVGVFATHFIPFVRIGAWRGCALVAMVDVVTLVSRFIYQSRHRAHNAAQNSTLTDKIPVAIVGAGQIGTFLAEELILDKNSNYRPMFFIDKDKGKVGANLLGLRVVYNDESVIEKIKSAHVEQVFIAISDLNDDKIAYFYDSYSKTGCKVKIYGFPIKEDGSEDTEQKRIIRDVSIEDLLFRDTVNVVGEEVAEFYKGKTVLVTGGGGSIGSELCRKIAASSPRKLIVLDIYENSAYEIQQELRRKYGSSLDVSVEIASVRDRARIDAIFAHYRPDIVFHAAAHKHVPLMEHNNCEAIKNNVFGTYNTADAAEKYGVGKFILISTDKAVNPTNVMGASKRLCEMVIKCRTDSNTVFSAVRFGNVLGSNGSVIPLFRNQIKAGGPITLTDRRIIRYFMTISEASDLVMQAGALARFGELFVLDMGKPVKIIDLAENMIKLSGLTPYKDIDIIETGLRPGEKLYEELLVRQGELDKTENNLIFIEQDTPLTRGAVEEKLNLLRTVISEYEDIIAAPEVTEAMKKVVPTFRSPEEVNVCADESDEMRLVASV